MWNVTRASREAFRQASRWPGHSATLSFSSLGLHPLRDKPFWLGSPASRPQGTRCVGVLHYRGVSAFTLSLSALLTGRCEPFQSECRFGLLLIRHGGDSCHDLRASWHFVPPRWHNIACVVFHRQHSFCVSPNTCYGNTWRTMIVPNPSQGTSNRP